MNLKLNFKFEFTIDDLLHITSDLEKIKKMPNPTREADWQYLGISKDNSNNIAYRVHGYTIRIGWISAPLERADDGFEYGKYDR